MKQPALTALIAGQSEITAIAGSYSQLRRNQGSWIRDLGRESAKPVQHQGVVTKADRQEHSSCLEEGRESQLNKN